MSWDCLRHEKRLKRFEMFLICFTGSSHRNIKLNAKDLWRKLGGNNPETYKKTETLNQNYPEQVVSIRWSLFQAFATSPNFEVPPSSSHHDIPHPQIFHKIVYFKSNPLCFSNNSPIYLLVFFGSTKTKRSAPLHRNRTNPPWISNNNKNNGLHLPYPNPKAKSVSSKFLLSKSCYSQNFLKKKTVARPVGYWNCKSNKNPIVTGIGIELKNAKTKI